MVYCQEIGRGKRFSILSPIYFQQLCKFRITQELHMHIKDCQSFKINSAKHLMNDSKVADCKTRAIIRQKMTCLYVKY